MRGHAGVCFSNPTHGRSNSLVKYKLPKLSQEEEVLKLSRLNDTVEILKVRDVVPLFQKIKYVYLFKKLKVFLLKPGIRKRMLC